MEGLEEEEKLVDGERVKTSPDPLATGEAPGEEPKRLIDNRWRNGGFVAARGRWGTGGDRDSAVASIVRLGKGVAGGESTNGAFVKYEDCSLGLAEESAVWGRLTRFRRGLVGSGGPST